MFSPFIKSASNSNEYQQYILVGKVGRGSMLANLLHSYANCLEILLASGSWKPHVLCTPV
jgi:hypothetical protein